MAHLYTNQMLSSRQEYTTPNVAQCLDSFQQWIYSDESLQMMGWNVHGARLAARPQALEDRLWPTWGREPKALASVLSVGSSTGGRMGQPQQASPLVRAWLEVRLETNPDTSDEICLIFLWSISLYF